MPNISWYRTPIPKEEMQKLTVRSDFKGFLQAFSFLLVYAAFIFLSVLLFLGEQWVLLTITAVLQGSFMAFLGMEASIHELSHKTPFKTRWINEFFYLLFSFLTWNNYLHFRESHMKHHQLTAFRGLDKEVIIGTGPYSFWTILSWFTFDWGKFKMVMFTNIAHFFGNGDADFFFWEPLFPKGDPKRKKMIRWARIMVIGHAILAAIFIYFQLWILLYSVTFSYFFFSYLGHGTGVAQHHGLCPNNPDWRVIAHSFKASPLIKWLYWRMHYHIEHHMYAAVPFYNLGKLHKLMAGDTPKIKPTLFHVLALIHRIHKKQKKDPSYCYLPEFPETAAEPKIERPEFSEEPAAAARG
ncbi:MAG: fatty acid desaturase [Spirochaetales bacterium]|nr:fatty acid desaturase [Spirochaetales bacterium]MCF7937902.1 fatty acid desaturase [Spirochaetales bacterium]